MSFYTSILLRFPFLSILRLKMYSRITTTHIPEQLQFCLVILVWMAMRVLGLTDQGLHTSAPARLPKIDIRPVFIVLSLARLTPYFATYFIRYAFAHEKCSLFSVILGVAA